MPPIHGRLITLLLILTTLAFFPTRAAVVVNKHEMAQKTKWVKQHLLAPGKLPPFSFILNGTSSADFLTQWPRTETRRKMDANCTERVITWSDPTSQIHVECVAVDYNDYPYVEWTVYLRNSGAVNTPILQDIQGLDLLLSRGTGPEFVLHGNQGDYCAPQSYEPFQIRFDPSTVTNFSPPSYSGKSSDGPSGWPYYNLQTPGGGIILAVGWPGQWASSFHRDTGNGLQIRAGQQLTHLYLKPGEQVRTPLIGMMFWQGTNVVRSQNMWRRWYLAHEMPKIDGKLPTPQKQIQVGGDDTNYVNSFIQAGITPTICWRDAGGTYSWYCNNNEPFRGNDSWQNTGTWDVDPLKYPIGFKPFSDWIHARGIKFVLWFEPERVGDPRSWLETNHSDWLLPNIASGGGSILNEGDPQAFNWLTNHIENLILAQGLDWYREDMNGSGPLPAWRKHDAPDRQGFTENVHVQGHLAYWDALLAMNPGLRIDSCASGGRRNDLETMRRAVPLLRSDFQFPSMEHVVIGNQCQTYGLSSWLPFQGTGGLSYDSYSFRSFYLPSFGMGRLTPENAAAQHQAYEECEKIAPFMLYGDYYPLTSYSLSNTVWIGWQFNCPETGGGCVQTFRRKKCDQASQTFYLNDLVPRARYKVINFDVADSMIVAGSELMHRGLKVEVTNAPAAVVITYQRVK